MQYYHGVQFYGGLASRYMFAHEVAAAVVLEVPPVVSTNIFEEII